MSAIYEEAEDRFVIEVEETAALAWEEESARVGFAVRCYDHVEAMEWRHLNVFSKESVIICALPRGRYLDGNASARGTEPERCSRNSILMRFSC